MAVWAEQVDGNLEGPCRVLRSDARAGDPLREFGSTMLAGVDTPQHWVIDNRDATGHLPLVDLARLVNLATTHPERFASVSLAWVSTRPMSRCLKAMLTKLPFQFREFTNLHDAYDWLRVRPN